MKTAFVPAALLACLVPALAAAQPPRPAAPPVAPAAPATPRAATPPAAAPGAAPAPATAQTEPTLPNIEDPMLVPPPPPAKVLMSWREAIDLARRQSTSLRTSLAHVDESAGRARQALSNALPQLSARAALDHEFIRNDVVSPFTGTRTTIPDPATTLGGALDLRIPLFAPAAWHNHGTAKDATELAKLDVKEIERLVVRAIADAMVSTITAERLSEVTRVSLASALSTVDLNKRRAALGASSQLDVLRAEQLVQDARGNVVTADETLRRSREALGTAIGSFEAYGVSPDIRLETLAQDARTYCSQEKSLDKRPDVVAANASVALAERRRDGVKWSFWPTLDAVSTLGVTGARSPNNDDYVSWTVGGRLNWLLYDGGERYGRRDELDATARVAKEALTDTRQRANTEVVQSLRAVEVATQNLQVFTQSREIAAETARLAKVAFMNGSGTSFDLVDTAGRLRQAEIDLTVKQFELLRARVAAFLSLASCKV
ncbi:MAG TPA: TolC family protein [Polyangiaceae bacterium]